MDKLERIKVLIQKLHEAAKAYYQEDREIISNYEYDRLYEELEVLEKETGIQLTNSPTSQVGYVAVEGLKKVSHEIPLLSLDKTKEIEALISFLDTHMGLLSWKLDGLTVVLSYENGALIRAVTRGNGTEGEDITHNAKCFINLPLRIPYSGRLLIRGEAVISYEDFEKINADITVEEERYKNPRNLCSGTVRQLDNEVVAGRSVRYYAFTILSQENNTGQSVDLSDKSQQLTFLQEMGFDVVEYSLVSSENVEGAVADFKEKLPNLGIPSDGLVLSYDDISYSTSLGTTSKFPKDSLAFKWEDELAETILRHIEWNPSRTGLINPIAIFDPVELEGTTVNKAGLHNVSIVRELGLGIGDRITVYKANMIIPQVAENLSKAQSVMVEIPETCPVCKGEAKILKQKEGEALYCVSDNCHAKLLGGLVHFCSRDAMNIEGLSEQTLDKWLAKGFVKDYVDIFALEQHREEIVQMEGFGEKSYAKLDKSIEAAKDVALENFIFALGIKHVGLSNAKLLCAQFGDLETLIEKSQSVEELLAIKGFGESIAQSLQEYFSMIEKVELIRKAASILRIKVKEKKESIPAPLAGLTFVITGSVSHFANRKALQDYIEERGGKCAKAVSASTSYLINNNVSSTSGKNKKAQSLGVPIISEEDFINNEY